MLVPSFWEHIPPLRRSGVSRDSRYFTAASVRRYAAFFYDKRFAHVVSYVIIIFYHSLLFANSEYREWKPVKIDSFGDWIVGVVMRRPLSKKKLQSYKLCSANALWNSGVWVEVIGYGCYSVYKYCMGHRAEDSMDSTEQSMSRRMTTLTEEQWG